MNHELSTKPRGAILPDNRDLYFEDDSELSLEQAFGVSHHRASERGRMALAENEFGPGAARDEGGY